MIYQLGDKKPDVAKAAFIADSATVIGDITLAEKTTIWPSVVIRADFAPVVVGENSNIQDNSTVHVDLNIPCTVGKNVTVGHNVILHSCTIGDNVIVGMGSTLLNNAKVGNNCIVGAGSLVTHKTPCEDGCLIMGTPAKIVRKLTDDELKHIQKNADHYSENGLLYKKSLVAIG